MQATRVVSSPPLPTSRPGKHFVARMRGQGARPTVRHQTPMCTPVTCKLSLVSSKRSMGGVTQATPPQVPEAVSKRHPHHPPTPTAMRRRPRRRHGRGKVVDTVLCKLGAGGVRPRYQRPTVRRHTRAPSLSVTTVTGRVTLEKPVSRPGQQGVIRMRAARAYPRQLPLA